MLNVGLCGLGTVGKGVYDIIVNNPYFKEKFCIKKILVASLDKKRDVDTSLLTNNYKDIVNDSSIDIVIELIGYEELAKKIIVESLNNKKDVVTANKALLAKDLDLFLQLSKLNNKHIYFEASVCGAIPIIDLILKINNSDKILKIEGILNGSTNYILTKINEGKSFNSAKEEAYLNGFLEADPSDDLKGYDALRKIIILSKLAYKSKFEIDNIKSIPMDNLTDSIINYLKENNYVVKYIARSILINNKIEIEVLPCALLSSDIFSNINNEMNIVRLDTTYSKNITISGYGAGRFPTASAVMLDLDKILKNEYYNLDFSNNFEIESLTKSSYLIDSDIELDNDYILKKSNNIYLTKPISYDTLNNILKYAKCAVKIN